MSQQPTERGVGPRLAFIDGLRGIAALAVVVQHTCSYYWPAFETFSERRFGLGAFAVALFFLCSGFVIPASLDRHNSLVQFWIGRVCRLYPLYWCSVGAALLLGLAGRFPLPPRGDTLGQTAALNLTMIQMLLGVPNLIGDYWTLCFEMLFYVLISLLFLLRLHRRSEWVVGMLFLSPLLSRVVGPRLLGGPIGPDLSGVALTLGLMFIGSMAYRWHDGALGSPSAGAAALLVPLGTIAAIVPSGGGGDLAVALRDGDLALGRLLSHLAAYGVFGLVLWRRRLPAALPALGMVSYSIYLNHRLIFTALPLVGGALPTALFSTALTLLVSLATYRLIERPGMALGKRLVARYAAWGAGRAAHPRRVLGVFRHFGDIG